MAVVGNAILELQGDASGLTREFKRVQSDLTRFTGSVSKNFKAMEVSWRGVLGVIAGATGAAFAAKKFFDVGAAVEETASKFRTTLGPEVQRAQKFLDEFANTAGLTNREGQDLLATTAAIGQGMGLAGAAAADMAVEVTKLAGDLASFNNIPIAETSRAVIGGITGERESLKRLGIVLLETEVQKRALADTGKKNVESLTQEEKALAALRLMYEKAGVAVGDLGRTKDSAANRAKALTARFLEMRDELARSLTPAFDVVLDKLEELTGAQGFGRIITALNENAPVIAAWTRFAIQSVGWVATSVVSTAATFANSMQIMLESVQFFSQIARLHFRDAIETFKSTLKNLDQIGDAVQASADAYTRMLNASAMAWDEWERGKQVGDQLGATLQTVNTAVAGVTTGAGEATAEVRKFADQMGAVLAMGLPEIKISTPQQWLKQFRVDVPEAFAEARTAAMAFQESLISVADLGLSAMTDAALGSKLAFRDFVSDAIAQLARLAVKLAAFKALELLFPGSGFVGKLGQALGFRAHGGPVSRGHPYIVGERGPEMFVPNANGTVVPNRALAGGGTSINLDFSRFPAPRHSMDSARDTEWITFLSESLRVAKERGWR